MAVRRKKAATMFPEQRPELFAVGLRNRKRIELGSWKEGKAPFAMQRGQCFEAWLDLKKKHQPVRLSLVSVLAGQTGQVKLAGRQRQSQFFGRFAAGAGVGRLARLCAEFAAARAPQTAIGFLGAFKQEHFASLIERVEQGGDVVGKRHDESKSAAGASGKREPVTPGRISVFCKGQQWVFSPLTSALSPFRGEGAATDAPAGSSGRLFDANAPNAAGEVRLARSLVAPPLPSKGRGPG